MLLLEGVGDKLSVRASHLPGFMLGILHILQRSFCHLGMQCEYITASHEATDVQGGSLHYSRVTMGKADLARQEARDQERSNLSKDSAQRCTSSAVALYEVESDSPFGSCSFLHQNEIHHVSSFIYSADVFQPSAICFLSAIFVSHDKYFDCFPKINKRDSN